MLVLPNEESVAVNPTIFFRSSHDTFCNWTGLDLEAGRILPIELGFNMSVSLMFSYNDSEVVYNVYTYLTIEDYEEEDLTISLAEANAFWTEVAQVCVIFGMIGGLTAIKVRSSS